MLVVKLSAWRMTGRNLSPQIVPTENITLGSTLPADSEIINIDSEEMKTIGSIFTESPYTLFILVRHYT